MLLDHRILISLRMSLQRLAVISAIGTHGILRNRTIYYDRPLNNDTFTPKGITFNQTDSLLVGWWVTHLFLMFFIIINIIAYALNVELNTFFVSNLFQRNVQPFRISKNKNNEKKERNWCACVLCPRLFIIISHVNIIMAH